MDDAAVARWTRAKNAADAQVMRLAKSVAMQEGGRKEKKARA
jgi:hypothetical protein